MREGRMDDGAREGKGGRLECLLSFWLRLPQWTQQAVALLKSQYRENEWRERGKEGWSVVEKYWGHAGGGCTTECLHEHGSNNV